jgi:hypothetical protein
MNTTGEELNLRRELLAVIESDRDQLKRFSQRFDRGDPRICKAGNANPRYFEKFGYSE